jgi:hypothetical protein
MQIKSWFKLLLTPKSYIFLLWLVVVGISYRQGYLLSGWDNLHPEFNLPLNISRSIFGVWQEYQGVGLVAGMAHAADLPRQLILLLLSLFVPLNYLRFLWWVLMLLVGPLGIYSLSHLLVKEQKKTDLNPQVIGFIAACFYLCNLATIQFFATPYEAFITFYGFLPWMLWSVLRIFSTTSTSSKWIVLGIIHLLATPAFYVQTLFIVYVMLLAVFYIAQFLATRSKQTLVQIGITTSVIVIAQLFWLLPVVYFSLSNAQVAVTAKQNASATQENILLNESRGNVLDVLRLGSYLLDFTDYDMETRENRLLLSEWRFWYDSLAGKLSGILIGVISLVGILFALIRFSRWRLLLLAWILLCFTMLMRKVFVFNALYLLLENSIPFFGQLFRTTFTKWAIPLLLVYALGFGITAGGAFLFLQSKVKALRFVVPIALVMFVALGIGPLFTSGIIKQEMLVKQPLAYQQLFTFFEREQSQARIAHLPVQSFWGWNYYSWGYRGSGFLWYGIEQPILDRAFDVWSGENEAFYNEMSTAIYGCEKVRSSEFGVHSDKSDSLSQCARDAKRVLEKYDVSYVMLDESIVAPGRDHEILRHEETKAVMSLLGWEQVFEEPVVSDNQGAFTEPLLHVWKRTERTDNTSLDPSTSFQDDELSSSNSAHRTSFVWAPEKFTVVEADTSKVRKDVVYERVGNYVEVRSSELGAHKASNEISPNPEPRTYYPFADVFKEKLDDVTIAPSGFAPDSISLKRQIITNSESKLTIPPILKQTMMPVMVNSTLEDSKLIVELELAVTLELQQQTHKLPTIGQFTFLLADPLDSVYVQIGETTWEVRRGDAQHIVMLEAGADTNIRLFDAASFERVALPRSIAREQVSQCWTRDGQIGLVEVEQYEESTRIRVTDASGCVSYPLGAVKENSLMKISVVHRSEDGARPHFCVDALGGEYSCEHAPVFSIERASEQWASVERFVNATAGEEFFLDLTARPSDKVNHVWTIEYQTPQVDIFEVLAETQLDSGAWERMMQDQGLSLPKGEQDLTLTLSTEPLSLTSMFAGSATNCDVFDRGEIQENLDASGYRMKALNQGSMCSVASLETIPLNQSSLLRLQGENVSGRSLKFYLSNWNSDRADLEYLLDEGNFDQVFSVLPWPQLSGSGYSLNLETRSFDAEVAENVLEKADLYPLPLAWLAGIQIGALGAEGNIPVQNELTIAWSQKFGTSHYVAEIQHSEGGMLALSQGFDEGWLGYEVDGAKCGVGCRLMPWWFGKRLEHVKVNGWANGWMLAEYGVQSTECEAGDDTCEANNENVNNPEPRTSNIVIVFWPQYLEWGGLLALGGLGLWLGVGLVKERKNKKHN